MKSTPVALRRKEEAQAAGGLTLADAMASPCATCDTSPCCSHLPLPGFPIENLMQFDHARYLLGFDGIELGLSATGEWSVFYTRSCRFLDGETNGCTLHGTDAQPRICQHYNPYQCWYRRALVDVVTPEHLRIDRRRFAVLSEYVRFDEHRQLIGVPTWDALQELFAELPVDTNPSAPIPTDPTRDAWVALALSDGATGRSTSSGVPSPAAGGDRCGGCQAYCCTHLQFPIDAPSTVSSVDYLRFALGFPGVEVGIAPDGWSLVVRTACRHLEGNRCGLYGSDERPLRCRYFDEVQCPYPEMLGTPVPAGFVHVDLSVWDAVEVTFRYDDLGTLVELPDVETVRASVEASWRAASALA